MNDTAVVAGLMTARHRLLLDDREPDFRPAAQDLPRHRETHDSCADDQVVERSVVQAIFRQGKLTVTLSNVAVPRVLLRWLVSARPT